ncbi:MAG: TRAP transporter fused permease subunit [Desulfobacula sp.]|uniref:TRAP transporter permease n=1 Tax=Desulfobacula sp. TaxID=2593537 RepID=UPI001DD7C8F2|nr:TRAP transporter fused permease subunit [Desulfobacula sp.]MBT3483941.1 TRAP transporter fused permease subunit [Desulfobacula sp.]MBT3803872.1 TRAP transporter fused permease subunit [Desulfobacula sp.]MBT4023817.1 TRAP transporter fused permease subunit [Desulfobacula sp.]MBT4197623.1 TRAP transporter fused permease subunit [Desulfobacula sp.]
MYEKLNRFEQIVFDACSVLLVLFYSYAAVIQPAATQYHRGVYIIITYVLVFLLYKSKSKIMRVVDYILIFLSIISIGYWIVMFETINYRTGAETSTDMVFAIIGVLVGIELARRVVGKIFVFLGVIMLSYGVYGYLAPDLVSHAGAPFTELCISIFYKSDGVFGIMANVLATYVILFVLFGAFLEKCGAQKFFIDWPLAAVGHTIGGPAKVSVIASGLFGSISGSAIANTVSTGMFTIPMMKKAGFKPHVAGGIEPAASIGGMFMPPIMGAGGFIMAELTGVPYSKIMLVAIFPALMYFFSVFCMVHYEAKKHNIVGEKSKISAMEIFKKQWFYALPLVVITIFMLTGYSPGYSAILGLVSCIYISWVRKEKRMDLTMALIVTGVFLVSLVNIAMGGSEEAIPQWVGLLVGLLVSIAVYFRFSKTVKPGLSAFLAAARSGTENSLKIGATVGVIGIIIGVLTFSGLVLTFADIMIELAGGSLLLTIFLVALASLVLGMGVPVTAAYLITAVVAVPALTHLGVNEIAAHMIVYWLSQDSNITPPVCIAAFAGATIAKANMWKTAFTSFKFAKFLYLGPILFGYVPGFSLNGSSTDIIKAFVLILFGTWAYSWFLSGIWMNYIKAFFKKSPT